MRALKYIAIAGLTAVTATPALSQKPAGVMGELAGSVAQLEKKVVDLAKAMPAATYDWRPGKARSTSEVLMHIAADNYFLPAAMGVAVPAETGINGKEYQTAVAFETRKLGRDAVIAELEKSFAYLMKSMAEVPDAKLDAPLSMFGMNTTMRGGWILASTHLHEHLGQMIAYARSNNIVPPWSQ